MNTSFRELRYPFTSAIEFIGAGFWLQPAGWHITLGMIFMIVLGAAVLRANESLFVKLVVLYFGLTVYNNPAYSVGGLRYGELCGVGAAGVVVLRLLRGMPLDVGRVGGPLVVGSLVIIAHWALATVAYPDIDPDAATRALRIALLVRVLVLGLVILGIQESFGAAQYDCLQRWLVRFGTAAAVVYVAQAAMFVGGTVPYGTYADAGFTGVPSFGAVSIERGHFGKFMVLLFPTYVYTLLRYRWRAAFALFLAVSLLNFSASNFAFLAGYSALTLVFLRRRLLRPGPLVALGLVGAAVAGLAVRFGAQYLGVIDKIVQLGLRGDAGGGRGTSVLHAYLSAYPLGTGYGGSTLRTVGTLPEINMGIFALVAQLSVVALPVACAWLWLNYRVVRASRRVLDATTRGLLVTGALMGILVGVADILWFTPTLWAPLILCDGLTHIARREAGWWPPGPPRPARPGFVGAAGEGAV